ncbi:hypothetical protein [Sphingomonas alpina]|uniref:Uncharacterized protein n=1 Tax=Sphingomonas alpina TaxID=653931 RepID=A0A7H0LRC0_9SPHN|nr:hypothetical protein [Sphingomonas alpina]QNQ12223.1 hypothetical protein H3Z74_15360 [Sphingomonas alpina]
MTSKAPHNIPTEATAEQGEVMLDGPDGLAVSLTPDAARRSAERIARAAQEARDQSRAVDSAAEQEQIDHHRL